MKVFVTGAAGYIGRAVAAELLANGHQVLGLVRSDSSAKIVEDLGGEVIRGDLEDLDSLKRGARTADGVIHLAFNMNFADFEGSCAIDGAAIEAMADAMGGTGKPLVTTTGTLLLPSGVLADEDTPQDRSSFLSARALAEDLIRKLSQEKKIRGMNVRLAPTVHGAEDKGFVPMLAGIAKKHQFATYLGDGTARWPAVHRSDAAVVYRLALEKGKAGSYYHATAEQGIQVKDLMGTIAGVLGLPVGSKPEEEGKEMLGFFAGILGIDNPTSSEKTREELGWQPRQVGILEDIKSNYSL